MPTTRSSPKLLLLHLEQEQIHPRLCFYPLKKNNSYCVILTYLVLRIFSNPFTHILIGHPWLVDGLVKEVTASLFAGFVSSIAVKLVVAYHRKVQKLQ